MSHRIVVGVLLAVALAGGGLILYFLDLGKTVSVGRETMVQERQTEMQDKKEATPKRFAINPLTGESCGEGDRRPLAVMLAADHVARPLFGISQADVVVEMPALTNGITRYMALFGCEQPEEIGSVRSARHDFLPFAKSFDAIFAHWGGSYLALDILKTGVIDNIDSIKNPFDAFWRKNDRLAPHNGFTSFAGLLNAAEKLNYRTAGTTTKGYAHIKGESALDVDQNIFLGYPRPYQVDFVYDHAANSYRRWRGGEKETDGATGGQVEVKNVLVMVAASQQVNADYNEVDVEGEGDLTLYRNGEVIKGRWKRAKEMYGGETEQSDNKYYFLDVSGKEIGLVEGKIWVSIVQPNQKVELTLK